MNELLGILLSEISRHRRVSGGALSVLCELKNFPLTYDELCAIKIEYDSSKHRIEKLTEEHVILILI